MSADLLINAVFYMLDTYIHTLFIHPHPVSYLICKMSFNFRKILLYENRCIVHLKKYTIHFFS